ncbi:MAG: hypothetical protein IJ760_00665 [Bacteroidales bacterium]|nr:hypothetical protein [Bacteroidales bacterium]
MKRFVLAAVMAAVAVAASAQPALSRGNENKYFSPSRLDQAVYAGQADKLDCWVTEGKKHRKIVAFTNANLWPQAEVELPGSADCDVLAASLDESAASTVAAVMVADRSEKRRTVVGRYLVDTRAHELAGSGMDTLARFDYDKHDECLLWTATSPNGHYNALVAVVELRAKKQYRSYVALLDAQMNRLWDCEYELGSMHQVAVTDDGRVVTFGTESEGADTRFLFNCIDSREGRSMGASLKCGELKEAVLAGVVGSHALVAGTVVAEGTKGVLSAGTLALSFNVDSAALSGYTVRPWQNEDINIFYNRKTKVVQKKLLADGVGLVATAPVAGGLATLYGRGYRVDYSNSNGQPVSDYCAVGLHCELVDTLGRVVWVRNIRHNDMQKEGRNLMGVGLVEADGKVAVVKCEYQKSPAQYDIAKEAGQYEAGGKCNLVVYSIDAGGEVQKLVVEKGSKQSLQRVMVRPGGNMMLLSSRGDKTRLAELMYTY